MGSQIDDVTMSTNIVFIDSRVADYQSLIDALTEPAEVFVLDSESDGLDQIAARLQGHWPGSLAVRHLPMKVGACRRILSDRIRGLRTANTRQGEKQVRVAMSNST